MMFLGKKISRIKHFAIFLWIVWSAFGMMNSQFLWASGEKLYNAQGKRDPFVQLVGLGARQTSSQILAVESLEEILIEGVVLDANPKNSIVIVNGSVMKEGEENGNVKLVKIKSDGAVFSVNGIEGYKPLYQQEQTGA